MAIREIRKEGDPILRKKCKEVTKFDEKLAILLDDMYDTMVRSDGVGLAGPQVGILKRCFVVDVGEGRIDAVNPRILETSGEQTDQEGCLSVPETWRDVTRPNQVTFQAFDREGKEYTMTVEGLFARAILHENDHLDGILFIDRVTE